MEPYIYSTDKTEMYLKAFIYKRFPYSKKYESFKDFA